MKDKNKQARETLINEVLKKQGIVDPAVLKAMNAVEREVFIPKELEKYAYENKPLPIGAEQTISQPFIVGFMTQEAGLTKSAKVLEIGTGSGYQAAVLALLCKEVYTIERIAQLGNKALEKLKKYPNVYGLIADGYEGWPEKSPFDAILITAASKGIPSPLVEQLNLGGRLIMPLQEGKVQTLVRFTKTNEGLQREDLLPVAFVPFVH